MSALAYAAERKIACVILIGADKSKKGQARIRRVGSRGEELVPNCIAGRLSQRRIPAPRARRHERERPEQKFVLALPSKGRLQEQCINFLSGCGFDVRRVGNGREYVARIVGVDDVDVIFLRPEEIQLVWNRAMLTPA